MRVARHLPARPPVPSKGKFSSDPGFIRPPPVHTGPHGNWLHRYDTMERMQLLQRSQIGAFATEAPFG